MSPGSPKKEESNKREINRDGDNEEKNKKIRKTESKENIPASVDKKTVRFLFNTLIINLFKKLFIYFLFF